MNASASICYGVRLAENAKLPWIDDLIEDWWRAVAGDEIDIELDAVPELEEQGRPRLIADWLEENPLPINLMNSMSGDKTVRFISVVKTEIVIRAGAPVSFNPAALKVPRGKAAELVRFCKLNRIVTEGKPRWWLIG